MSFILDALKKSEAERQRKSVPGFADIPDGRSTPRSQRWWWVVGGLLALNAAVLLGVFYLPARTEPPVAEPVRQAVILPEAVDRTAPATSPAAFSDIVAEARRNRPPQERPTTTEPQRQDPAPAATGAQSRVTMSEDLSTMDELRADGSLRLPELHLDIHVYSEKPAERFVFINMGKYKEGDRLAEGPAVREIRPDGVVLDQGGTRFLMPRQ
jgi:general secretion pathway protein B